MSSSLLVLAYIGPGAGFALAGSFLAVFGAVLSAVSMVLLWPVRRLLPAAVPPPAAEAAAVQAGRHPGAGRAGPRPDRRSCWREGKLPHLAALREQGCFKPLASTLPPISPVAWSSFQTGVESRQAQHLRLPHPDLQTYQPKLSSVEIRPPRRIASAWASIAVPLGKADVRLLRKSRPFWNILSDHGIFSCILRVPITFPPEKLRGVLLSAMCVPDLRGTQGMFSLLHHAAARARRNGPAAKCIAVERDGNTIRGELVGPDNPFRTDRSAAQGAVHRHAQRPTTRPTLKIDGATHELQQGRVHRLDPRCASASRRA